MNLTIQKPYLLFIGDVTEGESAKMADGIARWTPENVVGKLSLEGGKVNLDLPELSLKEAVELGAKTLVIGVVNSGGFIPEHWTKTFLQALEAGLDIASGMHKKLEDLPDVAETAQKYGRKLWNVRHPNYYPPIGTGEKRTGKRLLTVGTDCSVGKMFTALAINKALKNKGIKSDFRATGQTGILIEGSGVPIDAVIADFISGGAEMVAPENEPDHWDIIEGQGSLFHPSFAGVTIGLIHGSQPDALVLCHKPTRKWMRGVSEGSYQLPDLQVCMDLNLEVARRTNPNAKFVGLSINTSEMETTEAKNYLKDLEEKYGLPTVDPLQDGVEKIVNKLV